MLGAASGAVAGLVAITPACGFVGPMGAIVIGLVAGLLCLWGVNGLKRMLGADDTLDVFGVHGVSGFYLAHPEATYFNVGRIGDDQVQDLALRQGVDDKDLLRLLAPNL